MMRRRIGIGVLIGNFVLAGLSMGPTVALAQENAMVPKMMEYFPGRWEYKSEDGRAEGSREWNALRGGRAIGGPGLSDAMTVYSMAGWDPEQKVWLHHWHRADGQFGRLIVDRMEGDTYYGMMRSVEPDGEILEVEWRNKIVDDDHFVVTQGSGDNTVVVHWRRKPVNTELDREELVAQMIEDLQGRWVSETQADTSVEGYMEKGDQVRMEITYEPLSDQRGLLTEWSMTNGGKVVGRLTGVEAWDPLTKHIKRVSTATGGFRVESESWYEDDEWLSIQRVISPDGRESTTRAATTISEDGKTRIVRLFDRINREGKRLEPKTEVWKRVSKNHEMLAKHLGWLIGDWKGRVARNGGEPHDIEFRFRWIAEEEAIALEHVEVGYNSLNLILFDPADERIKMRYASSVGTNGQAILQAADDKLVWENSVVLADGSTDVRSFTILRGEDANHMIVKYVDQADGQTKDLQVQRQ